MNEDILGLGKIAEALEKGTKEIRELAKAFLEPAVKEKGQLLADKIKLQRFKNAMKVCEEADRILRDAGIQERILKPKFIVPIFEHASLEEDEELGLRWAGLLASAAAGVNVHPSYSKILSELTLGEAKILDAMYQWYVENKNEIDALLHPFPADIVGDISGLPKEKARIIASNLFRLELCHAESVATIDELTRFYGQYAHIYLSPLGFDFVKTCRGPQKQIET